MTLAYCTKPTTPIMTVTWSSLPTRRQPALISADKAGVAFIHPNPMAPVFLYLDARGVAFCGRKHRLLTPPQFIQMLSEWHFFEPGMITGTREPDLTNRLYLSFIYKVKLANPRGAGHVVLSTEGQGQILHHLDGDVSELDLQELRELLTDWYQDEEG